METFESNLKSRESVPQIQTVWEQVLCWDNIVLWCLKGMIGPDAIICIWGEGFEIQF